MPAMPMYVRTVPVVGTVVGTVGVIYRFMVLLGMAFFNFDFLVVVQF